MRDNKKKILNDIHMTTVYKNMKFTSKTVTYNIKM